MALTKISTDGVKDDAITKAKIPADQIEASELANDAVDTNAIQDDAVTEDKLANSINTAIAANTAKVSNATHTGDVTGSTSLTIANEAVTLAKLEHGTSSNDGKFLRANNGADPTFEAVSSDFVKISSTTMSGEASEFDLTFDNSTYSQFKLYICGLNLSYDANLYVRFRVGTTFITASNYYGGTIKKYAGGFDSSTYGGQHQSYGYLSDNVGGNDATYERWSGIIDILCGNSAGMPFLRHDSFYKSAAANHVNTMGIVGYQNWSVLSGIRVYASSGNINHGKFELYGVK